MAEVGDEPKTSNIWKEKNWGEKKLRHSFWLEEKRFIRSWGGYEEKKKKKKNYKKTQCPKQQPITGRSRRADQLGKRARCYGIGMGLSQGDISLEGHRQAEGGSHSLNLRITKSKG